MRWVERRGEGDEVGGEEGEKKRCEGEEWRRRGRKRRGGDEVGDRKGMDAGQE